MLFENRRRAESFGADAARYHRTRPRYPGPLVDRLVGATDPGGTAASGADGGPLRVLDVGCGTGIAATLLRDRGCDVLGVEIDERMAGVAREQGIAVEVAPLETWNRAGRTFDLVTCAQAWHWIDPVAGAERVADALVPGGRAAIFWNYGRPGPELAAAFAAAYHDIEPDLERYAVLLGHTDDRTTVTADGLRATGRFAEPVEDAWRWDHRYDVDGWLEHLLTHSDHQHLPRDRRDRLFAALRRELHAVGDEVAMTYEARLVEAGCVR